MKNLKGIVGIIIIAFGAIDLILKELDKFEK